MQVSHEAIYLSLYDPRRCQAIDRSLTQRLRSARPMSRPKIARRPTGRGIIRGMVSITARPAEVEDRKVPGHWEGDLVMRTRPSAVATLVERTSRYTAIVALPDGIKAEQVTPHLTRSLLSVSPQLRRTLTWDRGREIAEHQAITAGRAAADRTVGMGGQERQLGHRRHPAVRPDLAGRHQSAGRTRTKRTIRWRLVATRTSATNPCATACSPAVARRPGPALRGRRWPATAWATWAARTTSRRGEVTTGSPSRRTRTAHGRCTGPRAAGTRGIDGVVGAPLHPRPLQVFVW
ncbi:IS30 family transposase [Streptomyces sp. NBC_01431]|nr:IS30 family transposase [Streptomyces sp. NBC_01431]